MHSDSSPEAGQRRASSHRVGEMQCLKHLLARTQKGVQSTHATKNMQGPRPQNMDDPEIYTFASLEMI